MKRKLLYYYAKVFSRTGLEKMHTLVLQLSLRGLGIMNYQDVTISGERNLVNNILPRLFQTDQPIIFDVGANIGNFSREILARFPESTVYAFEPNPESYSALKKLSLPNFAAFNFALGKVNGEVDLFDTKNGHGSEHASIYENVVIDIHHKQSQVHKVKMVTLDEFALSQDVAFIDLIKIDTEGSELLILEGANYFLSNNLVGCIQFEFNEMNVISRTFLKDFRKVLSSFDLYRMLPTGLIAIPDTPLLSEIFAFQNILAVPSEKVKKIT